MPQDTAFTGINDTQYNSIAVSSGSLNKAVQHLKTVLAKEQAFQKRSDEYSAWAPLYTFLILLTLWIIIKLKYRDKENDKIPHQK